MATKPSTGPSETTSRIIERPRLTRLLDEASARIILLVAPAGYGKTTLARQWTAAKAQVAWYQRKPGSDDVAALAVGVADAIANVVPGAGRRMKRRLRGLPDPEPDTPHLADLLVRDLSEWPAEAWLVIDDYQTAMDAPGCEQFLAILATETPLRLLIASRRQPSWVTARHIAYGDLLQLSRRDLAMTTEEARRLLRMQHQLPLDEITVCAAGWPAILNLATRFPTSHLSQEALSRQLYDFFAEELFHRLSPESQESITKLAFVPSITAPTLHLAADPRVDAFLHETSSVGLLNVDHDWVDLHPLVRDFLRSRHHHEFDSSMSRFMDELAHYLISAELWDEAFSVIEALPSAELFSLLLRSGLAPLMDQGRIATVRQWLRLARQQSFRSPEIDLAEAEVLIREGQPVRAFFFARRAARDSTTPEQERSRAFYLAGLSAHLADDFECSSIFLEQARDAAQNHADLREALWGLFITTNDLELDRADEILHQLEGILNHEDPDDVLRCATARFYSTCSTNGSLISAFNRLSEAHAVMDYASDPRVISRFVQTYPQCAMLVGCYRLALDLGEHAVSMLSQIGVEFVRLYALSTRAFALAGVGDFVGAARLVTRLEREARVRDDLYTLANSAILRARLAIASGDPDHAVDATMIALPHQVCPGMAGELLATRALGYACLGDRQLADEFATKAGATSRTVEATTISLLAQAIAALKAHSSDAEERVACALSHVRASSHFDGLNIAMRAYPGFRAYASREEIVRLSCEIVAPEGLLEDAYASSTSRDWCSEISMLTRRERDVLDLVATGCSNQEIAERLYITVATVKVHLRHVFKKLDVQSRTEAAVVAMQSFMRHPAQEERRYVLSSQPR